MGANIRDQIPRKYNIGDVAYVLSNHYVVREIKINRWNAVVTDSIYNEDIEVKYCDERTGNWYGQLDIFPNADAAFKYDPS